MSGYVSQEDFFDNLFDAFETGIAPSSENLTLVRDFLLEKWQERAKEMHPTEPLPTDLADACKFSALFGSVIFAADIAGNYDHVYNVVDGEIIDINADAADIAGRDGMYRHNAAFINGEDFAVSMQSCVRRVSTWVVEFAERYAETLEAAKTPSV